MRTPSGGRSAAPRFVALSPDRLGDLLAYFEGDAFRDNPAWSSCYCQCYYEDHTKIKWSSRTSADNRNLAVQRCTSGEVRGNLAYQDGKVVGWCNAAPRDLLHSLDEDPVAGSEQIGCIVCFVVSPALRGRGIARSLLSAACDGLRAQGLLYVEANPRPDATGSGDNHFGPLSMYLSAGFAVDRVDDGDGSVWVRMRL